MESMRDINRVMEREITKGSSPLKLDHIEFGVYSYQEITSKEKLLEVLSYLLRIGDFSQYAGKTILNNVYMDLLNCSIINRRKVLKMQLPLRIARVCLKTCGRNGLIRSFFFWQKEHQWREWDTVKYLSVCQKKNRRNSPIEKLSLQE